MCCFSCAGKTRHAVSGPVQAGSAAGRDDDRTADGGNSQLSDRANGDAAVLPVDEHAKDLGHGTSVRQRGRVQCQRQRGHGRGWQRRRGWRGRFGVHERQRKRDGTHHVTRVRRNDTHQETQRRRPVQNRVRTSSRLVLLCADPYPFRTDSKRIGVIFSAKN